MNSIDREIEDEEKRTCWCMLRCCIVVSVFLGHCPYVGGCSERASPASLIKTNCIVRFTLVSASYGMEPSTST